MNWEGRGTRLVAFCVGRVIAGIVIGFAVARWTTSSEGQYESPGSILISADERTLTASAGGSCTSGTLDVRESPDTVVVSVHTVPSFMIGPGSCAIEIFSARLSTPLGSRQLIDGVTGARLPSFRGQGILRPAFLTYAYATLGTRDLIAIADSLK